jgi:hypothetical protein
MSKEQNIVSFISLTTEELKRIPYCANEDDFSTYYPNKNRIDKIAIEIKKYINFKKSHLAR